MEEKDKEIYSTEIAIQRKTLITRSQNSLSTNNMKKCFDVPTTLHTELLPSKRAKLIIS